MMGLPLSTSFGLLVLALCTTYGAGYVFHNDWDSPLYYECPTGYGVSRVVSYHCNRREDRRWGFECRSHSHLSSGVRCSRHQNVNWWDGRLHFTCGNGRLLSGVESYHDNHREDRRWSYLCCTTSSPGKTCTTTSTSWTGYINGWDGWMDWRAPSGRYVVGFYSYHRNDKEDRIWKVKYGTIRCY